MEILFILLPLALLIAGTMLVLFVWAVTTGQFDDLKTPALRILFDDKSATDSKKDPLPPTPVRGTKGK